MRSVANVTITFGVVTIPVKLYVSASDETPSLNLLTPAGNRAKQQWIDSVTNEVVEYNKLEKGYEFATGQFVRFTRDELAALEQASTKQIQIREFVDAQTLNYVQVEKNYYIGPDKGADKAYALISDAMRGQDKIAIAQWVNKGKEHLVIVRPYKSGLVLQILFYQDEVRDFDQIEVRAVPISEQEKALAAKLVEVMTNNEGFDPGEYEDTYAKALRDAVDAKVAGKEITIAQDAPATTTALDLFAALKNSLTVVPKKPKGKGKKGKKNG